MSFRDDFKAAMTKRKPVRKTIKLPAWLRELRELQGRIAVTAATVRESRQEARRRRE